MKSEKTEISDKILITICARGGSKGVKGKNIRLLNGKPLIYYTIKQALEWNKAAHIIVTTDSKEIADIAIACGAEVPFMRPKNLAADTSPTLPVLTHALLESEKIFKTKFDTLIDLPVTAPVRSVKDLENAYKLFKKKNPKNLVTVTPSHRNPYFNMLEVEKNGRVKYSKAGNFTRRQDAPEVYDMNNSIYIYQSDYLRDEKIKLDKISDDTIAYVMDPITSIDIDTETDFKILESLVKSSLVNIESSKAKTPESIYSLNEKVAFVNGGAGLIGERIVEHFAKAGAKVVLLDINKKKSAEIVEKLEMQGVDVAFEYFDITKLDSIDKTLEALQKKYKKIDVWVNTSFPRTPDWGKKIEDFPLESFQKNVSMHLNSYSWISRKVCMIMKKQNSGSLINFGSIYGTSGANFNIYEGTKMTSAFAYSAIKGGIINLSRYLASYFGEFGVRVNTICPGGIFDNQDETFVKNYSKQTPLKRMGTPEDIAPTALFLASDASRYITGATIMVDGGWSAI